MEKIKTAQPAAPPKKPNQPIATPPATKMPAAPQPIAAYPTVPQPIAAYPTTPQTMTKPAAHKMTKNLCESHMHRYVEVQAADGYCYDGIVEHVDDEWLCLAVPGSVDQMRAFGAYPPLHSPFGPYYPYRPRRFERLALPLAGLAAIALLPYYW